MLSNAILLITSILGFLCTALILIKNKRKSDSLINKYLIVITSNSAIRFLLYWIAASYPALNIQNLITIIDFSVLTLIPCYYLYFQNIIYEKKFELSNLFHFILPSLLGSIFVLNRFISPELMKLFLKLFIVTAIFFAVFYLIMISMMLYKHVWRRKTPIKIVQKQNDQIKNWCLFLYFSFFLIFIICVVTRILYYKTENASKLYLWMPALVWIAIFVKIILSPEILFGYDILNKTIDVAIEKMALNSIWKTKGISSLVISTKDKNLEEKMKSMLLVYLHQIEELSFHTYAFRNPELSVEDIAIALKIPSSHINYIIKYHCSESFVDFKKIVRIHDAIKLMELGYVKGHTVESLALKVGFSSYNTFIIAFKNITGLTVQEYAKRFKV